MKKYNLHLKEEYRGFSLPFPDLMKWGNHGKGEKGSLAITEGGFILVRLDDERVSELTQQEIDNLPHGFVKLFDLIEVEEELYYIKFPYCHERFLNVDDEYPDDFILDDKEQLPDFKTMFTEKEIEDKYPLFKPFAVKVKEEDNV